MLKCCKLPLPLLRFIIVADTFRNAGRCMSVPIISLYGSVANVIAAFVDKKSLKTNPKTWSVNV